MAHPSAWKKACALFLLYSSTAIASGQTFTKLRSFNGADGVYPVGYLVQGTDGNFYGTTEGGGANGSGTIFKLTPQGRLTTVYSFCSQPNCADGMGPTVGLILATDGSFYGTTAWGGDPTCRTSGCGTVFRITPRGELTTLHVFELADGGGPWGNLVEGADGRFYGTTSYGGNLSCNPELEGVGCGTIFRITKQGSLTTLHIFDYTDGALPYSGLVQATDGNFYGVTEHGGQGNCYDLGCGTVFKITSSGALTNLYKFVNEGEPDAPLIQANDGNFYSTTFGNTVFRITPAGDLTTLYALGGPGQFGDIPQGLTQATDGSLYGPTFYGGNEIICSPPDGCGTLYQLTLGGVLTGLHNFDFTNGAGPQGGMLQSTTGTFYGATSYGGRNTGPCPSLGCGTVYSLDMGLGPFIAFVHSSGKVGQAGGILGQGFTGTTSVSLNGTPASFRVWSDTYLTATVPAGATTGYVTVTTPGGRLTSNVAFNVIP